MLADLPRMKIALSSRPTLQNIRPPVGREGRGECLLTALELLFQLHGNARNVLALKTRHCQFLGTRLP